MSDKYVYMHCVHCNIKILVRRYSTNCPVCKGVLIPV